MSLQAPRQFFIPIRPLTAALFLILLLASSGFSGPPMTPRARALINQVKPKLVRELSDKGFRLGNPIFVRIFKMPGTLEIWMKKQNHYQLFKEYPICSYSGYPGPKLFEGDWQSPEGFYSVSAGQMNPNSKYHLSFDIGYPNAFDRVNKRTGSAIMVHGGCSSRGCFAMGDEPMEEIYLLAHEALSRGQERFDVHIFPFALSARNLFKFRSSPWIDFWKSLQPGFDAFEKSRNVPVIVVKNGSYTVEDSTLRLAMTRTEQDGQGHD